MRTTAAALVVFGLAAATFGQDKGHAPAAPPAPKVVTVPEWWQMYDKAVKGATTTLEKAERAKLLLASVVVECRGKIRDIAPAASKPGDPPQVTVVVCPVGGGEDMRGFTLSRDAITGWQQWDRVTWRVRPVLTDKGEIAFQDAVTPPAPARFPDPGIEPADLDRPAGATLDLFDCVQRFAKASYFEHRDNAAAIWDEICARSWVFEATVTAAPGTDAQAQVHLDHEPLVFAIRDTNHPKAPPSFGLAYREDYGEQPIRKWGVVGDRKVLVVDPQLAPLVRAGDRVELTFEFAPADCERAKAGLFPAHGRLWKDPKAVRRGK